MEPEGFSEENPGPYADHMLYANVMTGSVIIAAAVAVGLAVLIIKNVPCSAQWASRALAVVVALAVLVSSVMTGHEGARLAWGEETSQLAEK